MEDKEHVTTLIKKLKTKLVSVESTNNHSKENLTLDESRDLKKIKKISCISRGDDYQILFTASKKKSRIIKRTFKSLGIKISKIGNISSGGQKSQVIDEKGNKIAIKNKGHFHNF